MTLQMLRVEVGLCAMRTRKFAVGILWGDHCVLGRTRTGGSHSRTTWCTWQDTSSALRTNYVGRWLFHHTRLHEVVVLAIWGLHALLHSVVQAIGWHRSQRLWHVPVLSRSWRNCLGMGHGSRRVWQHRASSSVLLLWVVVHGHHLLRITARLVTH